MARPKPKSKTGEKRAKEANLDLEAVVVVLVGLGVLLAVALYADNKVSGEVGGWVRELVRGNLGLVALGLPPLVLLAAALLVMRRPLAAYFRWVGLGLLAEFLLLPLLAVVSTDLGGRVGVLAFQALTGVLGTFGLLVPLVLLTFVLDLAERKPPGSLLARALRRVGVAFLRLRGAFLLSRRAGRLAREVGVLSQRYPEHAVLVRLAEDLEAFRRSPGDGREIANFSGMLSKFVAERGQELAQRISREAKPLAPRLEGLSQALGAPLEGTGLAHALEERRVALSLEAHTLLTKSAQLVKDAGGASKGLSAAGLTTHLLLSAWEDHQARLAGWEQLEEQAKGLEVRADAWLRFVEWLDSAPQEAHPEALRLLLEQGLSATPPAFQRPSRPAIPVVEAPKPEGYQPLPSPSEPVTELKTPKAGIASKPSVQAKRITTKPSGLALPTPDLLDQPEPAKYDPKAQEMATRRLAETIDKTLTQFNIGAKVVGFARGPTVTRFELEPAPGEKISQIAGLANDLALALAAGSVRIEAPIPGKSVIGLEVPNLEREILRFSEAIVGTAFARSRERLPLVIGKSIDGEVWVRDLAKMPHLLIAGSTGSGKSVAINTLVTSLLFKYLPTELRLLMIDPKMVELTPYEGIPHLVRPVVTNPADAAGVLMGAVAHMERRYQMMSKAGARNLEQFNEKVKAAGEEPLPLLVIVIDELADLMITAPKEVEQAILRLAQMARATGMHLILATQRPSVDILTSLIKVNVPSRMAFAVSSGFDSRTILDTVGAERLVGQGDMLFHQPGLPKPVRIQGPFLSETEVHRIAGYLRQQIFDDTFGEKYGADFDGPPLSPGAGSGPGEVDFSDPLLKRAAEIVLEEGYASVSRLQRRLSVGHARAGKLVDGLEAMGIVGKHQGSKPREVLITPDQLGKYFGRDAN